MPTHRRRALHRHNSGSVRRPVALFTVIAMVAALVVGAAMSGSASEPKAETCGSFTDVTSENPFCDDIAWMATSRISKGYTDGSFRPGAAVNRQEMAAFIYRAANSGTDPEVCQVAPFDDVAAGSIFCGVIAWLKSQHITKGYGDGVFGPTRAINRQEMAAFLHRLVQANALNGTGAAPGNGAGSGADSNTSGGNSNADVVPQPDTTTEDAADVTSVSGDPNGTQTATLAKGAKLPTVGGYLVLPATPANPYGLVGKVTGVTNDPDGTTTVTTTPATLDEAFATFDVDYHGTPDIDAQPHGFRSTESRAFVAMLDRPSFGLGEPLFECTVDKGDTGDALKQTFEIGVSGLSPHVDFHLDIGSITHPYPELNFDVTVAPTLQLTYELSAAAHCKLKDKNAFTIHIPVPGASFLVIDVSPVLKVSATGKITVNFTYNPSANYGLNVDGLTVKEHHDFSSPKPTLDISGEAKGDAYFGVEVDLTIAGRIGLGGAIGPDLAAEATFADSQFCFTLTGSIRVELRAVVHLFVKDWNITLAKGNFFETKLVDYCSPDALKVGSNFLPKTTTVAKYQFVLAGSGGAPPYTWAASGLPGGLSLDSTTGAITGTPEGPGAASVALTVSDTDHHSASRTLPLEVARGALTISTDNIPQAAYQAKFNTSLNAIGGTPPYTWAAKPKSLPAWLTLSAAGVLSGTPDVLTSSPINVTVTDKTGQNQDAHYTVRIGLPTTNAIGGTVANEDGDPVEGATVDLISRSGHQAGTAITDGKGSYGLTEVPAGSYAVCFDPSTALGGPETGYADQCYDGAAWNGSPDGVYVSKPVTVTDDASVGGVDAALGLAGAISGTVRGTDGDPVAGSPIYVSHEKVAESDEHGNYSARGIPTGFQSVCVTGVSGHASSCYRASEWSGGPFPGDIETVGVEAGKTTAGIDVVLPDGGIVAGVVTNVAGDLITGSDVYVAVRTGSNGWDIVGEGSTGSDGTYAVLDLSVGDEYRVCAAGGTSAGTDSNSYVRSCQYAVAVNRDRTTTANFKLVEWTPGNHETGAISGKITDVRGSPLKGVTVDLGNTWHPDAFTTTSADGKYTLYAITPGSVELCTNTGPDMGKPYGYVDVCLSTATVAAGQMTADVNMTLSYRGAVSGTVTDSDGHPLTNATVSSGGESTKAWNDGTFELTYLQPGAADVCVAGTYGADGYRTELTGGNSVTGYAGACAKNISVDAEETTAIGAVELQPGGVIAGTISTDGAAEGVPVRVYLNGGLVAADSATDSGTYRIGGLKSGSYTVCAAGSLAVSPVGKGFLDRCFQNSVWSSGDHVPAPDANPVSVTAGSVTDSIGITLPSAGAISGVVTDENAAPVSGVKVSISAQKFTFTGASGLFTLAGLDNGQYGVCFEPKYAAAASHPYGLVAQCDNNITVAVEQTTESNVQLAAYGAISGRVTDTGNNPIKAVRVNLAKGSQSASGSTGANGRYKITGLVEGTYTVCFDTDQAIGGGSQQGYGDSCYNGRADQADADAVSVDPDQATTVDTELLSAGAIAGVVSDAASAKLAEVNVTLYDSDGTKLRSDKTNDEGHYKFRRVVDGDYQLCFEASRATGGSFEYGYLDQCYSAQAWDGKSAPNGTDMVPVSSTLITDHIDATLVAKGRIVTTVTDKNGAKLSNADVYVFDSDDLQVLSDHRVDDDGAASVNLASGTYTVCVDAHLADGGLSSIDGTPRYQSQCANGVVWNGLTDAPADHAKAYTVTPGKQTAVDLSVPAYWSLSGTVKDSNGNALANASVDLFGTDRQQVKGVITGSDGEYVFRGLGTRDYYVCFSASSVADGSSHAGYLDECYNGTGSGTSWNGSGDGITAAESVALVNGSNVADINAVLASAGGISGTVTDVGNVPLVGVGVAVYGPDGQQAGWGSTTDDGTYTVMGLTPDGREYTVCFAGADASVPTAVSDHGSFGSVCYEASMWDGHSAPPSTANGVTVTAGVLTGDIDATLSKVGAIEGTVTAAATSGSGDPLNVVGVRVFDANAAQVAGTDTGSDGTYWIGGLPAANYTVCFDASSARGGQSSTGYLDQCYDGTSWDGTAVIPGDAAAVTVSALIHRFGLRAG